MSALEIADLLPQVPTWASAADVRSWIAALAFPVLFALVCFCLYADTDTSEEV